MPPEVKKNLTDMSTSELLNEISCLLVVYVEPFLCSIGFLLNCACVAVFLSVSSHSYFRKTSLLLYLAALAVCNALQLLLSVFVIVAPAIEQFIRNDHPETSDFLHWFNSTAVRIGYPLIMSANYAAIWLLTLICAQKYQAICHPANIWKKRLVWVRKSKENVVVVVILALALNVIRYWEMAWNEHGELYYNEFRDSMMYKIIQEGVIYGFIVYGLTLVVLLILNYNIVRLIRAEELHVQPSRKNAEYRTALMTVCVFIVFFLCTTLSVSIRLFMICANTVVRFTDVMWIVDLSNLLMNINALITPIICFIFTRGFRDLFFIIRFAPLKTGSFDQKSCGKQLLQADIV